MQSQRSQIAMYQTIFDHLPVMIGFFDTQGRLLLTNRTWDQVLGYTMDQARGRELEIFKDAYPDPAEAARAIAFVTESQNEWVDFHTRTADGRVIETTWMMVPLSDGRRIAIGEDITERRQLNARFRTVWDQALDAMVIIDPHGTVIDANPAYCAIFQLPAESIIGYAFEMAYAEHQRDDARAAYRSLFDTTTPYQVEGDIFTHDGRHLIVDARGSFLSFSGEPFAMLSVVRDITERKQVEAQLHQLNDRLTETLESITDAFSACDRDWRLIYVNTRAAQMLGISREALIGKNLWELFPQSVGNDVYVASMTALRDGVAQRVEQFDQGRWFENHIYPTKEGGIAFYWRDITEHKQADIELAAAELRYRSLIEQMPAIIYTAALDRRSSSIFVSPQIEYMLGFTPDEWIREPDLWLKQVHPDDREAVEAAVFRAQHSNVAVPLEFRTYTRDGRLIWLHDSARLIRDKHGEPVMLQGVSIDITARKLAEAARRESEERYRSLIEATPSAIVLADMQTRIFMVTPQAVKLFAFSSMDHMIGKSIFELIHEDDHEKARHKMEIAVANGTAPSFEYRLLRSDRSVFWAELTAALISDAEGQPFAFTGVIRDISDQVRAREQLQGLSQRLIAAQETERRTIARELHDEIGQQLTGISLMLASMAPNVAPVNSERLTRVQEELRELIGRVRDISLDLRPGVLDAQGLIPALIWLFERYTNQTGISVRFEHRGIEAVRFRSEVETTAYRITQEALTNVARHAGVLDVTVRIWTDETDQTLCLTILDFGRGFDDQTNDTLTNGLLGMQERAALVGGQITIDTEIGGGTTISATLPILTSQEVPGQE